MTWWKRRRSTFKPSPGNLFSPEFLEMHQRELARVRALPPIAQCTACHQGEGNDCAHFIAR